MKHSEDEKGAFTMFQVHKQMCEMIATRVLQAQKYDERCARHFSLQKITGFADFSWYGGAGGVPHSNYSGCTLPSQEAKIEATIRYPIANEKGDLTMELEATLTLPLLSFRMEHPFRNGAGWKMTLSAEGRGLPASLRRTLPMGYRRRVRNHQPLEIDDHSVFLEWAIDQFIVATRLPRV